MINSGSDIPDAGSVSELGKPVATAPVRSLKIVPSANSVFHGAFVGDDITEANVAAYETMSGERVDIVLKFLAFTAIDNGSGFPATEAAVMDKRGGVLFIKLEPWSWNLAGMPAYSLSDIIAGKYDATLRKFATGVKNYGKPVFVTFGHEMNGNWYPWAGNPTLYKNAYIYVYNKITKAGATNITWVWNPHIDCGTLSTYYPGSNYVDWVALDGYNTEDYGMPWRSAEQMLSAPLTEDRKSVV